LHESAKSLIDVVRGDGLWVELDVGCHVEDGAVENEVVIEKGYLIPRITGVETGIEKGEGLKGR
jgi:hypothetical protein